MGTASPRTHKPKFVNKLLLNLGEDDQILRWTDVTLYREELTVVYISAREWNLFSDRNIGCFSKSRAYLPLS